MRRTGWPDAGLRSNSTCRPIARRNGSRNCRRALFPGTYARTLLILVCSWVEGIASLPTYGAVLRDFPFDRF